MPRKLSQTFNDELVKRNILTPEQLQEIIQESQREDKFVGQVLLERNILTDEQLLKFKSEVFQLPIVDFAKVDLDKNALKVISEDVAGYYKIVPFGTKDSTLLIGILNPEDLDALGALKFIAADKGLTLEKYIISFKDFDNIIKQYRTLTGEVVKALETLGAELEEKEVDLKLEEITAESPVTKIVGAMLKHAVESRASDIHIEPFEDRVRVRFRIDGVLTSVLTLPKNLLSPVVTRVKILSDLKIDETRLAQDGRFSLFVNKIRIDFRVSTFPTRSGEKVVMRILDPLAGRVDLEGLGVQGRSLELIGAALDEPFGIILITGPTGSGKSTTISALLRKINKEEINIVTLEDPVEYFIDGVNQSQIHEEIGYTFANGLRHILRQDPDVIMVGEIRDKETAGLAVQAALTGHVVLSTLHTNDALGVIPRLVDMAVEKYLIPPTLTLAVAQRLLRRLCPTCKLKDKANAGEDEIINKAIAGMPKGYQEKYLSKEGYTLYRPNTENPCKECGGKAYKGRIAIFEMLQMNTELEKIILSSLSEASMRQEAERQGMVTMYQDGIIKVLQGTVSLPELLEVAQAQDEETA